MSVQGRPLPTADVIYRVAQLEGQLSGGEIALPTVAGRSIAVRRVGSRPPQMASPKDATRTEWVGEPSVAGSALLGRRTAAVVRCSSEPLGSP